MFYGAVNFNTDASFRHVQSYKHEQNVHGASKYNGDISGWNTAQVTNMYQMFSGASAFNKPIGEWVVTRVTTMEEMFQGQSFQPNLSAWNTSSVTAMRGMFYKASSFDSEINEWDTSRVTLMEDIFMKRSRSIKTLTSGYFRCHGVQPCFHLAVPLTER